jgi:uncharacterized protein YndB with AHSA1/START domain
MYRTGNFPREDGAVSRRTVVANRHANAPIDTVWDLVGHADKWREWAAFTMSGLEREGAPTPDGVGAVRRFGFPVFSSREEVVAFEPPTHLGYILRSGLPLRDYRSDVTLAIAGDGTDIEWRSSFEARPADGWFWQSFLNVMLRDFTRRLARAAEQRS